MANPFNTHGGPFGRYGAQWYKPRTGVKKAPGGGTNTATNDPSTTIGPGDITTLPDTSYKDSTYFGNESTIGQSLANLAPYLLNQGQGLAADYGIDYKTTPTADNPLALDSSSLTINDTSNPYSKAALLKRAYQQNAAGDTNRMAAAGQGYAGAAQNAQNNDQSQYSQGKDALVKNFQSQWGGLIGQWLNANQTATGQRIQNQGDAIARHQNDPAAPPAKAFTPTGAAKFAKLMKNSPLYQGWRNHG